MGDEVADLRSVIGANFRRLRTERHITLDQVAHRARSLGLSWSTSTVVDVESGRRAPTLPTLLVLADSLSWGQPPIETRLTDLLETDAQYFRFTDEGRVQARSVLRSLEGEPVRLLERLTLFRGEKSGEHRGVLMEIMSDKMASSLPEITHNVGPLAERIAKSISTEPLLVAAAAFALWGRSVEEERDLRAGSEATAQKRGRVTRILTESISKRVEDAQTSVAARKERAKKTEAELFGHEPTGGEDGDN